MSLSLEQFKKHIGVIQKLDEDMRRVHDAMQILDPDFGGFCISRVESALIDLLYDVMGDTCDTWISYWIYDLDYGKNWKPDSVKEKDGTVIPLKTAEDLYTHLIKLSTQEK